MHPSSESCENEPGGEPTATCANHPVTQVKWDGARKYCIWKGLRLPSEAEWERAAKGWDDRLYVWGDDPVQPGFAACSEAQCADGYDRTAPVGSFPMDRSPVGCFDMAGNVQEWGEDAWHDTYVGAPTDGSARVAGYQGCDTVIRSHENAGTWDGFLRTTRRRRPRWTTYDMVGFRCAWSPDRR